MIRPTRTANFYKPLPVLLFLLFLLSIARGIEQTTEAYSWKAMVVNFAPSPVIAALFLIVYFLQRGDLDLSFLIERPGLSLKKVIMVATVSFLSGYLVFKLFSLTGTTLTFMTFVALFGALAAAALILIGRVESGVALFVLSLPLLAFVDDSGILWLGILTPTIIFMLICFLCWLVTHFSRQRKFILSPILPAFFLYFLASMVSTLFSYNVEASAPWFFWDMVFPLFFFLMVLNGINSPGGIRRLLYAATFAAALISFFGLFFYERDIAGGFSLSGFYATRGKFWGAVVVKGSINEMARYLILVIPVAIGLILTEKQNLRKFIFSGVVLFLVITLIITRSSDHWIALVLSLSLFPLVVWRGRIRKSVILAGASLLIILVLGLGFMLSGGYSLSVPEPASDAYSFISNILNWRLINWKGAIRMMNAYPITGIGISMWNYFEASFVWHPSRLSTGEVISPLQGSAHNLYLNTGAERGYPGLIALVLFFLFVLREGFMVLRQTQLSREKILASGILAGIIGYMLSSVTDGREFAFFFQFTGYLFFLLIACLIIMRRLATENAASTN